MFGNVHLLTVNVYSEVISIILSARLLVAFHSLWPVGALGNNIYRQRNEQESCSLKNCLAHKRFLSSRRKYVLYLVVAFIMTNLLPVNNNPLVTIANQDLLVQLLSDKRSANTRHAYTKDLTDFFRTIANSELTPEIVTHFLQLERNDAVTIVLKYKSLLFERKLKEATINRRLSAIKSLVNLAYSVGKCNYTLAEVKGEKVQVYRDTTGKCYAI